MERVIWLAIAYVGGIAAILGSLMLIGSGLLLFIPAAQIAPVTRPGVWWQGKIQLFLVSLLLTSTGVALLVLVPFPQ